MEVTNLFNDLLEKQALLEVGMDDVKLLLPGDEYDSIGTQHLNGCTGFVVLGGGEGKRGIVMAHAAPTVLPEQGGSSSGESARESKKRGITRGNKHFMDLFRRVTLMVSRHPEYFQESVSCCILASFENEIPLSDLEGYARNAFSNLEIPVKTYTYNVLMPGKGTVVAVLNDSEPSELWVEDKRKWPERDDTGALAMLFNKLDLGGVRVASENDENDDDENDDDENDDDENDDDENDDDKNNDDEEDDNEAEDDDAEEGDDDDEEKAGDRSTRTTGATAGGSTRRPTLWSFNSPTLGGICTYDESTDMIRQPNGHQLRRPPNIPLNAVKQKQI
jgi:hypothetical protein